MPKRKNRSAEFNAKVALEALMGERTVSGSPANHAAEMQI
jgi:hypothetical protein|tara:strand:+ start:541 stop:660 length:120 start_codon:yes stop_codon:yes gene_type:complete